MVDLHAIGICNKRIHTNEDLSDLFTTTNGWYTRVNGICSDLFITSWHIASWIGSTEHLLHLGAHGHSSILSSTLESELDNVGQ